MSLVRAIGRNTLIQFGGKAVGTALGLLTVAFMQRYLAPEGFGAYTTAMAYLGFLSVVADLGLYMILIRDLSRPGADEARVIGNLLGLRWVSAALILGAGAALIGFFPYTVAVKQAVLIGTASFVAIAATQLLVGIFQTKLAMTRVVIAELIGRIVLLAGTVAVVQTGAGLNALMLAVVGGSIANLLLVWWAAGKYIPLRIRFEFAYWRQILHDAWPVAVSIVLNLIYFRIDTIFLSLFSTNYDVGLYGAAYKVLEILNTFPIMFVGLLLPVLGRAFASMDHDRFQTIFQRGFELLFMAALPLVIGGWILAEPIVVAIGGSEFAPAAPILRLLLIAVAALFLNALSGHAVTIINRQRQMVWGYLSVAVIGVISYLILIPKFSYFGAASGTILTEVLTGLIGYILILRVMHVRLSLRLLPRILLATGLMAGTAYALRDSNIWLTLIIASSVYALGLIVTRSIAPATIREILVSRPSSPPELPKE